MGAAAAPLPHRLPIAPSQVLPAPVGLPFAPSLSPAEVTRASEAVSALGRRDPAALHGLLDQALRIARGLPFTPNGGKVTSYRLNSGEERAEIGLASLGRGGLGTERLVLTVDREGEVRVGVVDREMIPREIGTLGHVSRLVEKGAVSAMRFPTLAAAVGAPLTATTSGLGDLAGRLVPPEVPVAPAAAQAPPPTAAPAPQPDRLAALRDKEAERFVTATYAAGYTTRLGQYQAALMQVQRLPTVPPGLTERLERAGAALDKLRERAGRAGELAGLGKVLDAVAPQGIGKVTDSLGLVLDGAGLEAQRANVHGEATAAARAFDTEMAAIHRDLAAAAMPAITRLTPDVFDPNAAPKRREAQPPADKGVNLPPPRPPADPRASDPPPFPGREAGQREKPPTRRETLDPRDIGTKPFPPIGVESLPAPLPPEERTRTQPDADTPQPNETFEESPRAKTEPHVWPGLDLNTLMKDSDLLPGQREFLTYLATPEGQRSFREFAEMSHPWSDDPAERHAFIVEVSLKIREMMLMGTGSKSQAELGFVIYGGRDGGMRVHPEVRVGSPNSVFQPRGVKQLLNDPKVDYFYMGHTHPVLGPEFIDTLGNRVNLGSPVTGFSSGDFRAAWHVHDRQRDAERENSLSPKILEFGNVTGFGTVTIAEPIESGSLNHRVIGASGGVLEDGFSHIRWLHVDPGLVRPAKDASSRRQEVIWDAQGLPNGIPGYDEFGNRRP